MERHVREYCIQQKHEKESSKRPARSLSQEDSFFPSPLGSQDDLEDLVPNKIWKISPGHDAEYWEEWFNAIDHDGEGVVAIGWNVGDLRRFDLIDSLRKAVTREKPIWDRDRTDGHKTSIESATNQLWTFKNEIQKGDMFIIYSECRVLGIAEVVEPNYQYKGNDAITYEHQMMVRYRRCYSWPRRADDRLVDALGRRIGQTLKRVHEPWIWSHLLKTHVP